LSHSLTASSIATLIWAVRGLDLVFLPGALEIVVSSWSGDLAGRPQHGQGVVPRAMRSSSGERTWAPMRTAMSLQLLLAAVAEAGALTRHGGNLPPPPKKHLVDDQVDQGLPFVSSATMRSGRLVLHALSSSGQQGADGAPFWLASRCRVPRTASCASWS